MITTNAMKVNKNLENLVYLYILIKPEVPADVLYATWYYNSVFREYNRPSLVVLEEWYARVFEELELLGIKKYEGSN